MNNFLLFFIRGNIFSRTKVSIPFFFIPQHPLLLFKRKKIRITCRPPVSFSQKLFEDGYQFILFLLRNFNLSFFFFFLLCENFNTIIVDHFLCKKVVKLLTLFFAIISAKKKEWNCNFIFLGGYNKEENKSIKKEKWRIIISIFLLKFPATNKIEKKKNNKLKKIVKFSSP